MDLGKLAYQGLNVGIPAVAGGVSAVVAEEDGTGLGVVAANAIFGFVTAWAPGERRHRYFGGGIISMVVGAWSGFAASPFYHVLTGNYKRNSFDPKMELSDFLIVATWTIFAQILAREIVHLPETLRKANQSGETNLDVQQGPWKKSKKEKESGSEEEDSGGGSGAIVPVSEYGSANRSLLPMWEIGEGQILQELGDEITEVEYEEYHEQNFFGGNTKYRKRKMKTATGGEHIEEQKKVKSWFWSTTEHKKTYKGGRHHSTDISSVEIEEIE